MASTLLTPPAVTPVTLEEAKAHLRVTHADEDTLISDLIETAARFMADNDGICCIHQTWRYYVGDVGLQRRLHRFPIARLDGAVGYDVDGNASAIPADEIKLDYRTRPAALCFAGVRAANGADVDIVFGFGETAVDVPDTLRRAILVLVTHWYEFRGAVAPKDQPVSLPEQYNRLIAPYRVVGLGAR
ncbi:MAG: head-tail connector protein [Pseudomonadota bacterium]